MKDEGIEKFGGTKDVAETHKFNQKNLEDYMACLLYTSPSPRDLSTSRMPSSA